MSQIQYRGPVVLAILDGFGLSRQLPGNAVKQADLPFLSHIVQKYPSLSLQASGEAVGVLPGQMGNSEVGHLALGTGQIIPQGSARVQSALQSGEIWQSSAWRNLIQYLKTHHSVLHFSGIFSDGGVHSDISHLMAMIKQAHQEGISKIRLHLVLDGRDVAPQSAERYIKQITDFFATFPGADYQIASGGGRMVFVADRYQNDWSIVKAGWDAMVHGQAPYQFESALQAIQSFRAQDPNLQDQYLPPFIITRNQRPVGQIVDHDALVYFDFRADRAVEISMAFTEPQFSYFDRGYTPEVFFAGLSEYDSDRHLPAQQLVAPLRAQTPLNQFLANRQITQLAISETVKFGHITYYFNGNSYEKAAGEQHLEISSDTQPFDTRPWMKSAEITDATLERLDQFQFLRLNFPGADMVGHFGELTPTRIALEAIDLQLSRLAAQINKLGGVLLITADHGNAEELIDNNNQPKTSHTTNPVPLIFYDNTLNLQRYQLKHFRSAGLANVAATIALLLGQTDYPDFWQPPLIEPI